MASHVLVFSCVQNLWHAAPPPLRESYFPFSSTPLVWVVSPMCKIGPKSQGISQQSSHQKAALRSFGRHRADIDLAMRKRHHTLLFSGHLAQMCDRRVAISLQSWRGCVMGSAGVKFESCETSLLLEDRNSFEMSCGEKSL